MLRSSLFQVEADVEIAPGGVSHATISCLQWRSPNLAQLEVAAKQTLALMWYGTLDDQVCDVIEKAHLHGALAPVSMIKVRAYKLHLFLADEVSSKTLPALEALWENVKDAADVPSWAVHFSNISEIIADQTDDVFCATAKEILWLHNLGLSDFEGSAEGNQLPRHDAPAVADVSRRYLPQRVVADPKEGIRKVHDKIIEAAEALSIDEAEPLTPPNKGEEADQVGPVCLQTLCMLRLMAAGVRPQELRNMRVGVHIAIQPDSALRIESSKARPPVQLALNHEAREQLFAYIKASGLVEGNYLFPSRLDPNKMMRSSGLAAFLQLWHLAHGPVDQAWIDRFVSGLDRATGDN